MLISLPGALEKFVNQKVSSGQYESTDAVIWSALWLLQDRERTEQENLDDLRNEIAIGLEQADQGMLRPFDPKTTLERVRQKTEANQEIIT